MPTPNPAPKQGRANRAGAGIHQQGLGLSFPLCKVGITPKLLPGINKMVFVKDLAPA